MCVCSVGMLSWHCYKQETQHAAKARSQSKHNVFQLAAKRKRHVRSAKYVKRTQKEFLFGTMKYIFLDMCGLCFLSEALWKIVIFVLFILFHVYLFLF